MTDLRVLQAKFGGLAIYTFVRSLMRTLDYQALFHDRSVDPLHPSFYGSCIYIFWHEFIPCPFYLWGHCNIAMLISQHRDAEWLSQATRHMGFQTVRGSTQRGGVAALRELWRKGRQMNLTITPDGPRGPRRHLASGCIYLASRLEIPLVPFGVGYQQAWRLPTWDRFALPRPYSTARIVLGPRLRLPADLDRDGIEHYRQRVERLLNHLTQEAETWAQSGMHRPGQQAVIPRVA